MNRKWMQILSIALCVVLLYAALPVLTASAAITENGAGELVFTSFEDLQQLCKDSYPDAVNCIYEGPGALTISGDLTIPQMVTVAADGMVVEQGAVLTVNGQLAVSNLTVEGRMVNYGVISVLSDLYVNGTAENGGIIYMYAGVRGILSNPQNLKHLYEEAGVIWVCDFENGQQLAQIAEAAANALDGHYAYGVYSTAKEVTLDGWVSLPSNCIFVVTKALTVIGGEGCGLELACKAQIDAPLTVQCDLRVGVGGYLDVVAPVKVEGNLENMAVIDLYYDNGGRLTVSGPKGYIGHYKENSSLIFVNSTGQQLPADAVTGLDVSNFRMSEMNDPTYGHYWMLYDYKAPASESRLWGDVNGDGIVESYDATLLLQFDVSIIDETGLVLENMDVSGDGIIDSYDATLILQYDVGIISAFPVEA